MDGIEIRDVTDESGFGLVPPCADPAFDHRTCDYWEDAERGSRAHRASWLSRAGESGSAAAGGPARSAGNPFAPPPRIESNPFAPASGSASSAPAANPFAPPPREPAFNPFLGADDEAAVANPFAPSRPVRPTVAGDAPRKLQLLGRGLGVFGSYAKILVQDGTAAAYCQFGPLSAYPRALRTRELYPQLPDAPLPAVITCIATTANARDQGHAARLVRAVCDDLAGRGFAAVEAYPEVGARPDATSAASPAFWVGLGFRLAVDDERFPVVRLELD